MEKIIEPFRKLHPEFRFDVEGGGSSAGITSALTGTAQVGMSSRDLKKGDPRESMLLGIPIAIDAIIVVVNKANPIENLTLDQLRKLFSGGIRNWKEVGGLDRSVHLIVREEGSGTRSAFDDLAMKVGKEETPIDDFALVQDSMGGVREVIRNDPDAIGFISLGGRSPVVRTIRIDGIFPTLDTVKEKKYKLVRPFLLLSNGPFSGMAKELLDFTLSATGSEIIVKEGYVDIGAK